MFKTHYRIAKHETPTPRNQLGKRENDKRGKNLGQESTSQKTKYIGCMRKTQISSQALSNNP